MKRIFEIIPFVLFILVGTIVTYSDALCAQNVTWTIKNGTLINGGSQYRFEVWARATDDPVLMQGTGQSDGSSICLKWNANAFHALGDGVIVALATRWKYPYYTYQWGGQLSRSAVRLALWPWTGASPQNLSQDAPDGEIICTVTLTVFDASSNADLAWCYDYVDMPNVGIRWGTNAFTMGANTPLPIQLASFKATALHGKEVALTWTTASEINNYGFEVQRSSDGKTFVSIAGSFVKGNGTTNQPHAYSFVDVDPGTTVNYRLKQMDLDGTVNYSETIQAAALTDVKEAIPAGFALEQNYPNPFNPTTTIRYSIPGDGPVRLDVFNVAGELVAHLVEGNVTAGIHELRFDGSQLSSGVYLYRLQSGTHVESRKLLLLR